MTGRSHIFQLDGNPAELTVDAVGPPTNPGFPPSRRWRVWAKVAGPQLPDETIAIGSVFMGSAAGMQKPPEPVDNVTVELDDSPDVFYMMSGTYARAITNCWCWSEVEATTAREALDHMEFHLIPTLAASFSIHSPVGPYRFRMMGAVNLGSGEPHSARSRTMNIIGQWGPSRLTPGLTANFQSVFQVIDETDELKRSAHAIHKAASVADLGSNPHLRGAALLGYYQAIEAAATIIPQSEPDNFEPRQEEIFHKLRADLANKSESKNLRRAVATAEVALSRLEAKYVSIRIENAARVLGLPNRWSSRFKELSKVRNQKLGHASSPLQPDSFAEWFSTDYESRAEWVANEFLKALVLWKRTEKWKLSQATD